MDRIFVQIPAYRDSELSQTLLSLYRQASEPRRLRTAVIWQRDAADTLAAAVRALPDLEIEEVPWQASRGCNWARSRLQASWSNETYTLLIDSHMRFVKGWDDLLIAMYEDLRERVPKPMLTAYLPGYEPEREPGGRQKRPNKLYPHGRQDGILIKLIGYPIPFWTALAGPVEADFASLHFIFTAGTFNRELPFDPDIYFSGDEVATSIKAYLAGYDLFHPHRVVGWHCYARRTRVAHWDDHADWPERERRSFATMRNLFSRPIGMGSRTLASFEDRIMMRLVEP